MSRAPLAVLTAVLLAVSVGVSQAGTSEDRDCADFPDQASAQRYYESKGGPQEDPDRLDGDNDGTACDTLPCPCAGERGGEPAPPKVARRTAARITTVTDGDTLNARATRGKRQSFKVRLIGIDTPETRKPGTPIECGGPEASASLKRLGTKRGRGRLVTLTTDPTQDTFDRFGRLLAYVTRRGDGKNLGEAQLRAGLAEVYVFRDPFRLLGRFRGAESAAREASRGVWGTCGGDFHRSR